MGAGRGTGAMIFAGGNESGNKIPASAMYSSQVLDHFEHPRNSGTLADADASARIENPACGDVLELTVKIAEGRIAEIRFRAKGCVAAMACGSAVTELVSGKTVEEARKLSRDRTGARGGRVCPWRHRMPVTWRWTRWRRCSEVCRKLSLPARGFSASACVVFRRVEAGLFQRIGNRDVGDALGVRVQDFAGVAGDGRSEKCAINSRLTRSGCRACRRSQGQRPRCLARARAGTIRRDARASRRSAAGNRPA